MPDRLKKHLMPWTEIALPGVLLITKFLQKLVVDRSATLADFIQAVFAVPVDIVFLSASLIAGYVISSPSKTKEGLVIFIGCICLSMLVVLIWRRCEGKFTKDKYLAAITLALVNMFISGSTLMYALSLLTAGVSP